jgi:hypothetical protein
MIDRSVLVLSWLARGSVALSWGHRPGHDSRGLISACRRSTYHLPRLSRLNVAASMQPLHMEGLDDLAAPSAWREGLSAGRAERATHAAHRRADPRIAEDRLQQVVVP